ncbi:hypothetical protein [Pseudomonas aeruginosa]
MPPRIGADPRGSRLDSQNSLSVSLGGVLDNQGGALVSEGSLTARAARLDNRGGSSALVMVRLLPW